MGIPLILLYLLGMGAGWIYRGFKQPPVAE